MTAAQYNTFQESLSADSMAMATAEYEYLGARCDGLDCVTDHGDMHPGGSLWDTYLVNGCTLLTPPRSPHRDCEYTPTSPCEYALPSPYIADIDVTTPCESLMSTSDIFNSELGMDFLNSKVQRDYAVVQDCMWSGVEQKPGRARNVSLSELDMATASTSCIDPTTFTAFPRQHNQVEHNYSLATPEPMRVPALHCTSYTPTTTDDSESEEDLIDVVTVDNNRAARMHKYARVKNHTKTLHAVAQQLSAQCSKRPKCMADLEFVPLGKKMKRYNISSQSSILSSQGASDSEECGGKRSAHNVMERHRRNELKTSLHGLRDSLPTLETQERAPKVVILSHATRYIRALRAAETNLSREHKVHRDENLRLKQRLADLHARVNIF